jgi:hypothetical protein
MSNYPNGVDTFTTVKPDDEMLGHASKHNNEAGAIVAIETELGENPSGSFDSVKLRLDGVDAAISSVEIYDDTVLSEAVTKNTNDIANLEAYDDTVVKADIDKNTKGVAENAQTLSELTTATLLLENPEDPNTLFSVLSTQQQANEYFASEIENKVSVATTWGQLAGNP